MYLNLDFAMSSQAHCFERIYRSLDATKFFSLVCHEDKDETSCRRRMLA